VSSGLGPGLAEAALQTASRASDGIRKAPGIFPSNVANAEPCAKGFREGDLAFVVYAHVHASVLRPRRLTGNSRFPEGIRESKARASARADPSLRSG
jgi:hypothetical protein